MKKLLVLGVLLAALFVAPVDAKPVHAAGSISLIEAAPTYNSWIHFNYVYPAHLKDCHGQIYWNCAYTRVECFQGTTRVWFNARPSYDSNGAGSNGFLLGSPDSYNVWQQLGGGAADCVATLFEYARQYPYPMTDHASVAFHVEA